MKIAVDVGNYAIIFANNRAFCVAFSLIASSEYA
ncbi:MAG: hypothetical protein ACI9HK_001996 [Pirellulaceae bacterium]|jgi:hypothetical protein